VVGSGWGGVCWVSAGRPHGVRRLQTAQPAAITKPAPAANHGVPIALSSRRCGPARRWPATGAARQAPAGPVGPATPRGYGAPPVPGRIREGLYLGFRRVPGPLSCSDAGAVRVASVASTDRTRRRTFSSWTAPCAVVALRGDTLGIRGFISRIARTAGRSRYPDLAGGRQSSIHSKMIASRRGRRAPGIHQHARPLTHLADDRHPSGHLGAGET